MKQSIRIFLLTVAAVFGMAASHALADAGTWAPETATDPNFIAGKKAIDANDWKKAIDLLNKARVNADVHNYLGYA